MTMTQSPEHYILATGGKDARRLRLLHDVFGPGTEAVLRRADYSLGLPLHRLFRDAGFARPEVGANFALAVRGERKRLLGVTFTEFAPELVQEGLATQVEVDRVTAELFALADGETALFGFPLVVQVWAEG